MSCVSGWYFDSETFSCVLNCPKGSLGNQTTGRCDQSCKKTDTCDQCVEHCSECISNNPSVCLMCDSPHVLNTLTRKCVIPDHEC